MSENQMQDYEERYVAFVDLLGFKSRVESAEQNPAERVSLVEILTIVKETLGENPHIGFRFSYFSDCMLISVKRSPQGLYEMFASLCLLTTNLLQHDILLRGGLTAGGAYHGKDFVYGTAVNRAVILEGEAKNPMILISKEICEDAEKYGDGCLQWVAQDNEGRDFIHYLINYTLYRPMPIYQGMVMLERPAGRIIDFICQRLNKDQGNILAKAEWFRVYWNETVAVHGVFSTIERGVTERYDSGGPTIGYRRMYVPTA